MTKKTLSIVCVVILVLLATFIGFRNNNHQAKQSTTSAITENTTKTVAHENTPISYNGGTYTFSYPSSWTKSEKELNSNEGTVLTIQPSDAPSGEFTNISVEVLNGQTTSVETLTNVFRNLHYHETTSTVNGITAQNYSATLQSPNGLLHSIAYIFKQNNKIYFLKLEYIQPSANEQLEDQFNQIVNSFTLQ